MLSFIAIALAIPNVVAGPDLARDATAIEAPIAAVTVYSDRARVVREGRAPPGSGVVAVRFPDLPGALQLDSLRLTATGGKVLRVEATPVERSRRSIDQVDALLDALEANVDTYARLDARRQVYRLEAQVLAGLDPAPLPSLEARGGRAARIGDRGWLPILDLIEARQQAIDTAIAALDAERRTLDEAIAKQRKALGEYDVAAFSAKRIELVALVQRGPKPVSLRAEYLVPGAKWTPVYGIEREPGADRITLRTAGLVTQTTGEDWADVQVTLSTAIPSVRIGMPRLLTWTLGESRDFVLRPQPKQHDRPQRMQAVQPQQPVDKVYADWSLGLLRERIATAKRAGSAQIAAERARVEAERRQAEVMARRAQRARKEENRRRRREAERVGLARRSIAAKKAAPRPPAPPADAPAEADRASFYDFDDQAVTGELPMPDGAALSGDEVALDINSPSTLQGFAAPASKDRRMAMGLRDNRIIGRGPVGPAGSPARLAGGLDYRYRATTRMTLPSQPEAQRVPLAVDTYPATPFYAAAPGIKPIAFLKATVQNKSGRPLLAGPVNIFVGTDFVGEGRLDTTGAGATLELPLGADEDIKIVRRVLPKTQTEGVFSADDVTVYSTIIEVGNYKRRPVRIRIAEQVPLAGHDKVKIKRGSMQPKPVDGPDKQGLMAFDLQIAPGKTETIRFDYTVTRPENWKLRQR